MGNAFTTTLAAGSVAKLNAVNVVLKLCGRREAPALDTGGNSAAADIERIIDEQDEEVQIRGWYWNTEYDVEYTAAAADDEIDLGTDILHVDSWEGGVHGGPGTKQVVKRGVRLYDIENNTFTFDTGETISTKVIRKLDFDLLPLPAQRYIAALAADGYYQQSQPAKTQNPHIMRRIQEETNAWFADMNREDGEARDPNLLHTSQAQDFRGRRQRFIYRG